MTHPYIDEKIVKALGRALAGNEWPTASELSKETAIPTSTLLEALEGLAVRRIVCDPGIGPIEDAKWFLRDPAGWRLAQELLHPDLRTTIEKMIVRSKDVPRQTTIQEVVEATSAPDIFVRVAARALDSARRVHFEDTDSLTAHIIER